MSSESISSTLSRELQDLFQKGYLGKSVVYYVARPKTLASSSRGEPPAHRPTTISIYVDLTPDEVKSLEVLLRTQLGSRFSTQTPAHVEVFRAERFVSSGSSRRRQGEERIGRFNIP